jgi:hypothetical protein
MLALSYRFPERPRGLSFLPFLAVGAYLVTSIFYIFPSGMPQPADFVLLLAILITLLWSWSRVPKEPTLYLAIGLFVSWIVLVNVVWFFLVWDFLFLKKASFYLYNAIVFLFVVAIGFHSIEWLKKVIRWACIIALVMQVVYVEVLAQWLTGRATGTFNNPNQLAYWATLVMACMALAKDREPLGWSEILALTAGLYVTLLSASRAGSASVLLLIVFIVATCRCRASTGLALAAVLVLALLFEVGGGGGLGRLASIDSISRSVSRLESRTMRAREQGSESITKRGYDQLLEFPEYLAFGAGEGAFKRLNEEGKEFHSTLGNVLMSYGVVGLTLFGTLLLVVFARAPWTAYLYMVPIMIFGVTNMGLRFSEFWIFLGLVYAEGRYGLRRAPILRLRASRDRPLHPAPRGQGFAGPAQSSRSDVHGAGAVDGDSGRAYVPGD